MDRIAKLKSFMALDPGDFFSAHALGLEYVKAGDDQSARRVFEDILRCDPTYTGTYYHLGKLLERSGDAEAARKVYDEGLRQSLAKGEANDARELRGAMEALD